MDNFAKGVEAEIPRLRRYARALMRDETEVDDLVQDTLMRGLAKRHLWQTGTDMRAWLFTIMHNQYVNYVRSSARGRHVMIDDAEPVLSHAAGQEKRLELRDLARAMAKLPLEQRTVVLLMGLEKMSYEAVARIVGTPVGTVRSRLSRGREALRSHMGIRDDATKNRPIARIAA
jgi:RNA polymerase sigma-70 factor, ECF subfamily